MRSHRAGLAQVEVLDRQALAEIELYAELVIAASAAEGPLAAAGLDEVLGLPVGRAGRVSTVDLTEPAPRCIDLRDALDRWSLR